MAERKQFLNIPPIDPAALEALERARDAAVSEEELAEQRISFAYGNAINADGITKDSVRLASSSVRLRRAA